MKVFLKTIKFLDYGDLYLIHTVIGAVPEFGRVVEARGNVFHISFDGLEDPNSRLLLMYGSVIFNDYNCIVAELDGQLLLLDQAKGFPEPFNEEDHRRHMELLCKWYLGNDYYEYWVEKRQQSYYGCWDSKASSRDVSESPAMVRGEMQGTFY